MQQQPLAEAGDRPVAGVAGWSLCRIGAEGTSLGQTLEGNGAVFLFSVKCFGSDSLECLPSQAQFGELGGRVPVVPRARMGASQLERGTLQQHFYLFYFSLPQRKAGAFVCVLIMFSRSSFHLLREMCCPWCPFEEQSVDPFFVVVCLHGAEFLVETFPVLCPKLLASPGPRAQG